MLIYLIYQPYQRLVGDEPKLLEGEFLQTFKKRGGDSKRQKSWVIKGDFGAVIPV